VRRDVRVVDFCAERNLPVVVTLGGGYRDDAWEVQYASIRRTIETYGVARAGEGPYPPRQPTLKEKYYTK